MPLSPVLSQVEPLERQTLGDKTYAQLSDLLASGRLAPGDKVSLRGLADAFGVSMMPVREAVTRLVADRALEVTPNRAIRVPLMTRAQFRELTALRIEVEGYAAAQAAKEHGAHELARIAAAEDAFRRASKARAPDLARAVELNKEFHFALYGAAGSTLLVEVIRSLWLKAGPVINLDLRASPDRLASGAAVRCHAAALAAVRKRDAAGARRAVASDIAAAAEFIVARGELGD